MIMNSSAVASAHLADLFGAPIISGLVLAADVITEAEERELIARIDNAPLMPFRFHQWTGKRLTHSYGCKYDFESHEFAGTAPIPDWLEPLKQRAEAFAGLEPTNLVQAMLTRYDPGAGIGWHRDRRVFEHVVGVSLGSPAIMRFRRRAGTRFQRFKAPLPPRSIYHLSGEARHEWEHSIAEMGRPRWSITFRSLAAG